MSINLMRITLNGADLAPRPRSTEASPGPAATCLHARLSSCRSSILAGSGPEAAAAATASVSPEAAARWLLDTWGERPERSHPRYQDEEQAPRSRHPLASASTASRYVLSRPHDLVGSASCVPRSDRSAPRSHGVPSPSASRQDVLRRASGKAVARRRPCQLPQAALAATQMQTSPKPWFTGFAQPARTQVVDT
jgi:hypothetical protein